MLQHFRYTLERIVDMMRTVFGGYRTVHTIDDYVMPVRQPQVYEYIDPVYVEECLVDLESDFTYEVTKDDNSGVLAINIFHNEPLDKRARQIEELIKENELQNKLLQGIDLVIEKIKLEYPNFIYHIHNDMTIHSRQGEFAVGGTRQHGTQIFRILDYHNRGLGHRGLEGMQGVAGERYNVNNNAYW